MNCKDTQNLIQPNNAYHRFADRKVLNLLRYLIGQWFFKLIRDWNTLTSKYVYLNVSLVEKKWAYFHQYSERSPGVLGIRPSGPSLVGGNCQNKEECLCARWDRRGRSRKQCGQETKETFFSDQLMGNFSHQLFYCWFFWDRIIHFCPWNCMAMNLVNLIREGSLK